MSRGGARPGAGRKPGSATKRNEALRATVAATGLTPIEVMLFNMREHHADAIKLKRRAAATKDEARKASLLEQQHAAMERSDTSAKRVADFIHPKLQSVMHNTDPENVLKVVHTVDTDTLTRVALLIRGGFAQLPAPKDGKPAPQGG